MHDAKSLLVITAITAGGYALGLPESSLAQEATAGIVPTATMEPGEPEQRLREFFEGDYHVLRETWDYPSKGAPKTVRCTSTHSMEVGGFVLFVRETCDDGTEFLGLHSFDRKVNKYINPGFSNGSGYVGSVYAEFQGDGTQYVGSAPTTDPRAGDALRSRFVCELNDNGYVFESFLIRADGTEFLERRETYTRTQ